MAYFIKHCPKELWDVYLVKAESAEAVLNMEYDCDAEKLLGDFVIPSNMDCEVFGPFATEEEAMNSDHAWVENRA